MKLIFDIETTGLDPFKDRVTAIGLKAGQYEHIITYEEEALIIQEFWDIMKEKRVSKLIGFNCNGFDIPFLIIRSFKYRISVPYLKDFVLDLRLILSHWNRFKKGKLEEYAKMIGVEPKYNGYCGEHIPLLWKEGRLDELREYLLQDVRMTWAIFERLKEIGLVW